MIEKRLEERAGARRAWQDEDELWPTSSSLGRFKSV
jgi:hypothetical protein